MRSAVVIVVAVFCVGLACSHSLHPMTEAPEQSAQALKAAKIRLFLDTISKISQNSTQQSKYAQGSSGSETWEWAPLCCTDSNLPPNCTKHKGSSLSGSGLCRGLPECASGDKSQCGMKCTCPNGEVKPYEGKCASFVGPHPEYQVTCKPASAQSGSCEDGSSPSGGACPKDVKCADGSVAKCSISCTCGGEAVKIDSEAEFCDRSCQPATLPECGDGLPPMPCLGGSWDNSKPAL